MDKLYDVIILGAGPAGLSAGIYAKRSNLKTLIIEKGRVGGQILNTSEIANYPGFIENISGSKLISNMVNQCNNLGVEIVKDLITYIDINSDIKVLTGKEHKYKSKTIIIATGSIPKKLKVKGEKELTGKGVSYCAICDADFFTDLEVFVVGGGDSAVEESIFLSKFARKVTIVCRSENLHCSKYIEEKARKNSKIYIMFNTNIKELHGKDILESIVFENTATNEKKEYFVDESDEIMGVFIFIGLIPQTEMFKNKLNMDDRGYIISNENMNTNLDGVFVAGDCRVKSLRQVVTATSDGAIASIEAQKYIESKEGSINDNIR